MSLFTDWIIKGINHLPWYLYPKAGVAHIFLVTHCIFLGFWAIKLLLKAMKDPTITSKNLNHIRYILTASMIVYSSIFDFLGNYNIPAYSIGPICSTIFLLIISTAIVKHQLMDIQVVIRKSLVYSLLVTTITIIFLASVFISQYLVSQTFHNQNIIISLITACLIALIFVPLQNKIQDLVDRALFKATHLEMAQQNEQLRLEVIQTEKLKAVAALASSLVHEIRNPLTAINTFTEYLPQKKHDPAFLDQFAKTVPSEINRINSLMEELLAFAKPSEPKFESINSDLLIQNAINLLSPQLAKKNIQMNIQLINTPIQIQADPSQLKQILLNIIMNAIDAMPNGGTLNISTSVIASEAKQSFAIEISDTGCGIAPEYLKHIFEPFFTKKEKGTGLGLAITQGIIEKHGGTIAVESQLHKGTTFKISLPIDQS